MCAAVELLTQQCQRMAPEREALGAIVRRDVLPFGGRREQGCAFGGLRHGRERQLLLAAGDLPESQMTVAGQLAQRARVRQRFEFAARKIRAQREILHAGERLPAARAAMMRSAASSPKPFTRRNPSRNAGSSSARRSSVQSQSLCTRMIGRTSTP